MPLQVLEPLRGNFLYGVTEQGNPEHLRSRNRFVGYFPVFLCFLSFASDGTQGSLRSRLVLANSCWPQPGQGAGQTRLAAVTCNVVPRPFLTSLSSCCQSTMHRTRLGLLLEEALPTWPGCLGLWPVHRLSSSPSSTALSPALRMYSRESHWTEFLQRPCQVVP